MRLHVLALLVLAALAAGCRSNTAHLKSMQRSSMADLTGRDLTAGLDPSVMRRQNARIREVREIVDAEGLETAEDHFYAALILVSSSEQDDLLLAQGLGKEAGELGDRRGLRVVAAAEDKLLVIQGKPQRWGTQIVYEPTLGRFRLASIDPRTTDEQRAEMGVAPRAELERRLELANELKDEASAQ